MATKFHTNFDETHPFTDSSARFRLAAATELTYTIPGDNRVGYRVEFQYTADSNVYVGYNVTATIPAPGTVETTSQIEFRPKCRYVRGGDVISVISPDADTQCGLTLLKLPVS